MRVQWNDQLLQTMGRRAADAVAISTRLTAIEIHGGVGEEAPVRSGRLAGGFDLRPLSALSWAVFTLVSYAKWVALGTLPHIIEPKNATVLRFQAGGEVVFATRVKHPGTPANLFLQRAIQHGMDRREEFLARGLREVGLA